MMPRRWCGRRLRSNICRAVTKEQEDAGEQQRRAAAESGRSIVSGRARRQERARTHARPGSAAGLRAADDRAAAAASAAAAAAISRTSEAEIESRVRRPAEDGRTAGHRKCDAGDGRNHDATGLDAAESEGRPGEDSAEDEGPGALTTRWAGRSSSCTGSRNTASSSTCCGRSRRGSARRRCSAARPLCSVSSARSACDAPRHLGADHEHHARRRFCAMITASVTASTGGVSMMTQSNGPLRQVRDEVVHPLRREQLGRVRRRAAGGDHEEVRVRRALDRPRAPAPGRPAGATARRRSAGPSSCAGRGGACRRR